MKRSRMLAVGMGTVLWILILGSFMYAKKEEEALETSLIRFHILAHSDSEEDQQLKLKVRDAVLKAYQESFRSLDTVEEAQRYLRYHLSEIQETAEAAMQEEGYDYKARVSLTTDAFPTKQYGNIKLPAGYYQALRIELGDAEGHNWWCVMFPPICYSMEEETLPEEMEQALEETLEEDTNGLIHYEEADTGVQIRFKIVELWNRLEQWIAT